MGYDREGKVQNKHISGTHFKYDYENVFTKKLVLYASEKAEWNEGLPVQC